MDLTLESLSELFSSTRTDKLALYVEPLNEIPVTYGIDTPLRLQMFLAQVGHESGGLSVIEENLNYSATGLLRTFPKYFTVAQANVYARHPEMIANRVYANRMGNKDEFSGDGWRYRGRGLIQLTGANNYQTFASHMMLSVADILDYALTPDGAVTSACWYWEKNTLNYYADQEDVKGCTYKINGGYNGLKDRESLYEEAKRLIS